VDAICINQEDIPERNHQITLMRDIYESARQTVVWLGEAADDSGLAFQLIEAWGNCNNYFDGFLQKPPSPSTKRCGTQRTSFYRGCGGREYGYIKSLYCRKE
jgi:hypothetical protein